MPPATPPAIGPILLRLPGLGEVGTTIIEIRKVEVVTTPSAPVATISDVNTEVIVDKIRGASELKGS